MDIFVCSTYYHALIACIKALRSDEPPEIALLGYIPGAEGLSEKLRESGIFSKTYFFPTPRQYVPKNKLDLWLNLHKKNRALLTEQFYFDFSGYGNVFLFHDDTWLARYMKETRQSYRLIEDALDIYRTIQSTKFAFMLPKTPLQRLKGLIGYGYRYLGSCPQVLSVEVNDARGLDLGAPLIEVPREPLFASLSDGERERLARIFLPGHYGEINGGTLIFTEPYADDGLLDEDRQKELFGGIIARFSSGGEVFSPEGRVFVKPHPRDGCEYGGFGCRVLPAKVPFEIIELCCRPSFSKAVLMRSSTMLSYPGIKRCCKETEIIDDGDIVKKA